MTRQKHIERYGKGNRKEDRPGKEKSGKNEQTERNGERKTRQKGNV